MDKMKETKNMIGEIFLEIGEAMDSGQFGSKSRIGITTLGSEHGIENIIKGAEKAQKDNTDIKVVLIGPKIETSLEIAEANSENDMYSKMEELLEKGEIDACVTMHYNFPIGVATVGKVITPGKGREMFLATTTGTSATERVEAMVKNAIYGIACAKAQGIDAPTVCILNVDAARSVERSLQKLSANGYPISFAQSVRQDGGSVMRGNDLLVGAPEVMVTDTLTGNVLMKVFSAYTTGGDYETLGYGYGPGVGEGYDKIVHILSRASGAPVVSGAIRYAADMAKGRLLSVVDAEFKAAHAAGLADLFKKEALPAAAEEEDVVCPPAKVATEEIAGIDILDLETAAKAVWKAGIFASTGMGCTGPVILVATDDLAKAQEVLIKAGYISA